MLSANDVTMLSAADKEEERCCICLEPIEDTKMVTLRCCHKFHGQCLCDALVHDGRCPVCRDSPYNTEVEDDATYLSFQAALQRGCEAAKTDKKVARMNNTIQKWRKERTIATREYKEFRIKMKPLDKHLLRKIDDFAIKETAKFEKKHAKLLLQGEEIIKKRRKAYTYHRGAQMRMALKHGFVRAPRRGRHHSRSS